MSEYVICSVCKRKYKGIVPKGGDGSCLFPARHYRKPEELKTRERPSRYWRYCPGSSLAGIPMEQSHD